MPSLIGLQENPLLMLYLNMRRWSLQCRLLMLARIGYHSSAFEIIPTRTEVGFGKTAAAVHLCQVGWEVPQSVKGGGRRRYGRGRTEGWIRRNWSAAESSSMSELGFQPLHLSLLGLHCHGREVMLRTFTATDTKLGQVLEKGVG